MSLLRGADGRKFIVSGPFDEDMPFYYVVIADMGYWIRKEREIYAWMEENLPRGRLHQVGMLIQLETEQQVTAFIMRWS